VEVVAREKNPSSFVPQHALILSYSRRANPNLNGDSETGVPCPKACVRAEGFDFINMNVTSPFKKPRTAYSHRARVDER
jgi:hypothetical protein